MPQGESATLYWGSTAYADRSEPPADAVPEAANFPTETYEFNMSHDLFKAPQSYPAPPQDMWYKVPDEKPKPAERPKPIFPWEREVDRPKATRVFAEDDPPEPEPVPEAAPLIPDLPSPTHPFSTVHYEADGVPKQTAPGPDSPDRASSPKSSGEQWQAFQQSSANAWDSVPGIDTYVRAIMDSQVRRGKTQVVHHGDGPDEILSPTISRKNRRESLILTDFPTAVERPSLPVTPAPVARPTFWGEERDEQGDLPQAEGVPDQAHWVCPQCGFSSVSESDFCRPSREPASIINPVATISAPATTTKTAVPPPKVQPDQHQEAKTSIPPTSPPKPTASPPKPNARSGVSSRGAPLASLTNPTLLAHHEHVFDASPPSASASTPTSNLPSIAASAP
jgi:glycogenin glucosyltransferase